MSPYNVFVPTLRAPPRSFWAEIVGVACVCLGFSGVPVMPTLSLPGNPYRNLCFPSVHPIARRSARIASDFHSASGATPQMAATPSATPPGTDARLTPLSDSTPPSVKRRASMGGPPIVATLSRELFGGQPESPVDILSEDDEERRRAKRRRLSSCP